MGAIIPKLLSLDLVKLLIKTGLFKLIFRKFTKYTRLSVKAFLDEISDNDTFKLFMTYAFGGLGRFSFLLSLKFEISEPERILGNPKS